MLGGLFYYLPELIPAVPPTPIAIEQVAPEPASELNIIVLQTLPEFASVLVDLPETEAAVQVLKTTMTNGTLNIQYGDTQKHIPIFPETESVILHSTFTDNRVVLEVSKL